MKQLNSSFRDISGYIFCEDNIIYRCINKSYREHYDYLMSSGLYSLLISNQYLVSHNEIEDISRFNINQADVYKIIKPYQLPFVSYPYEWSFTQLKEAAVLTLKIQLEALKFNMMLKDATAFNIQFHCGKPVFIDTLSFEKYEEGSVWQAYSQFCRHFLAPLSLTAYCDYRMYNLSAYFLDGIPLDYASKLLPLKTKFKIGLLMHLHLNSKISQKAESRDGGGHTADKQIYLTKQRLINLIENLLNTIQSITYNASKANSSWNGYYSFTNYDSEAFKMKETLIISLINKCVCNKNRIIDLGSNNGYFSRVISKQLPDSIIISSDLDYHAVDENYKLIENDFHKNIYPLVIDITNPPSNIGWGNLERDSFLDRIKNSDILLALALIHHISITNNVPFDKSAALFSECTKYLIIEFVPIDDSQTMKIIDEKLGDYSYYNIDNFEKAFLQYFSIIEKNDIINTKRTLYLMERK